MPSKLAALIRPYSPGGMPNSREISGSATPVTNMMKPTKNLPQAASAKMRHCIKVIGTDDRLVPSAHIGSSSI